MISRRLFAALILSSFLLSDCEAENRQFVSGSRLTLGTEVHRSASVRTADFDNDGDLDIVVANGRHWPQQNFLFLNQGRALFTVARRIGEDMSTTYACEPADFDGDGDLDIAVGNDNAPCRVVFNDGTGRFAEQAEFGKPSSVRSLTTGDIDGDGDIDILTTCRGQANRIYFNDGKAAFGDSKTFGTERDSTIDVAIADLNGDDIADLILVNRDGQSNYLLLGRGQGQFAEPIVFGSAKISSRAVATGDFNGDKHVDWVVGNIDAANVIYLGDGKGGVMSEIAFGRVDGKTYALEVADLNNDNLSDVVVANVGQQNAAFIRRNDATLDGKVKLNEEQFDEVRFGDPDAATYGLCVGDFNDDGFVDVAVANSDSMTRVFLNRPASPTITE